MTLPYDTSKVLAVSISKSGRVTAIARSKKPGNYSPTDDTSQVIAAAGPYRVQLSPSRGQAALFSFETFTWRPHYPLVETYFLNEAWPLGQGDLDYGNFNRSAMRYDHPEDSDIVLTVEGLTVTWHNSTASKRSFALEDRPDFLFENLVASLRLRSGIGGSLTISKLNADGTTGTELFRHTYS